MVSGNMQLRSMMNTAIALFGSVIGTACHARIMFGKLEMVTMLNATLAGAVMIGPCVDIITNPGVTLLIGLFAGLSCSMSFEKLTPFLQKTIGLQDTCGVHNLHCIQGVIGAVISAIAIAGSGTRGFGVGYFPLVQNAGDEMSQAYAQIWGCVVTCFFAIVGGLTGGYICSRSVFQPVHALYRDDDHMEDIVNKYPAEFLVGGDESYEQAKANFLEIQQVLKDRRQLKGDDEDAIKELVEEIWEQEGDEDSEKMSKEQIHSFFVAYLKTNNHKLEMSQQAFD